jgi:hypothetical protein
MAFIGLAPVPGLSVSKRSPLGVVTTDLGDTAGMNECGGGSRFAAGARAAARARARTIIAAA